MSQILTQVEAILKDKYQPALANQISTCPSPLLEKIKRVPLTNNTIKCASPIGINGGFGFGAEGAATLSPVLSVTLNIPLMRWICTLISRFPTRRYSLHPPMRLR